MKRRYVTMLSLVCGCAQTGTPELSLLATPASIRTTGELSTIRVTAIDARGDLGKGTVTLQAALGSLREPVELELEASGTTRVALSCDGRLDPECDHVTTPSFTVQATWLTATAEVQLSLVPPPLNEPNCGNAVDDDEDGLTDCQDPDCEDTRCDDGEPCTVDERCELGACTGGAPRICVNAHPFCADVTCVSAFGCVTLPKNFGLSCSDDDACTTNDRCDPNGRCTGARIECHPFPFACQRDPGTCDRITGQCRFEPARDGTSCGPGRAEVCCGGSCTNISLSSEHCGGCGVRCPTTQFGGCRDAEEPSGCGPQLEVSGRCGCQSDDDCPSTHECLASFCSPKPAQCRLYQTRHDPNPMVCPAYCTYN